MGVAHESLLISGNLIKEAEMLTENAVELGEEEGEPWFVGGLAEDLILDFDGSETSRVLGEKSCDGATSVRDVELFTILDVRCRFAAVVL